MELIHTNKIPAMNEYGNPTVGYLRMPRTHNLRYLKDKNEIRVNDYDETSLCNSCRKPLNSTEFLNQSSGLSHHLCESCTTDILVDEIVNKVLRNVFCYISELFAEKFLNNQSENIKNEFSNTLCNGSANLEKSNIQRFPKISSCEEEIKPEVRILNFSKFQSESSERSKEECENSGPSRSNSDDGNNSLDQINSLLPSFKSVNFEKSTHFQQESNNLAHHTKSIKTHPGISISQFYTDEVRIGKGKFGKVSRVTHIETKKHFASKTIIYRSEKTRDNIINEIEILDCLHGGRHIMELIEAIDCNGSKPKAFHIISEYLDGGELFDQIANTELLTEKNVIGIMCQILDGVNFIHSRSIIHRDLKPENIVYCSKNNDLLKIIDFGFAVKFDEKHPPKSMVGTTIFVAPEVLRYEPQGYFTDIWSVGVIAFNLLAGITPFEIPLTGDTTRELSDPEIIENIERCRYDFSDEGFIGISEEAKSFISSLLIREPSKRLSASECLKHKWLSSCYNKSLNTNLSRSISLQRMKNYVAVHKWQKLCMAIKSVSNFKNLITS